MDSMVTARMQATKKEAGNRVLESLGTNAVVVDVGALVASGHNYGLIFSITMVALFEGIDEFIPGDIPDIGETMETNLWKRLQIG